MNKLYEPDKEVEAKLNAMQAEIQELGAKITKLQIDKATILEDYWIEKLNMYPGRILDYNGEFYRFVKFDMSYTTNTRSRPWIFGHKVLASGKSHKSLQRVYEANILEEGHPLEKEPVS